MISLELMLMDNQILPPNDPMNLFMNFYTNFTKLLKIV